MNSMNLIYDYLRNVGRQHQRGFISNEPDGRENGTEKSG